MSVYAYVQSANNDGTVLIIKDNELKDTSDDFLELEKLLINLPPRTKAKEFDGLSIYELVDKRTKNNHARIT